MKKLEIEVLDDDNLPIEHTFHLEKAQPNDDDKFF